MGYDICLLKDPRHEVFCREYAVHRNGTKAYQKAFTSATYNAARTNASKLLADANIQRRVSEIQVERLDKLEVTHEKILQEMAKLAFVDVRDFYNTDGTVKLIPDMDPDCAAALEGVKVSKKTVVREDGDDVSETETVTVMEIKHGTKREALRVLAQMKGLLKETQVHEGEVNVNHTGAVGVTDDVAKLDALRAKFRGFNHGEAGTPA